MKRLFPLYLLFAATIIASCKSTGVVADNQTHGVDASGNVWMNPPPVGQGIQIAIMPFDVPADSEVQGDFYTHIPSDVGFDVSRIEIAMNEGTHHMNLYRSNIVWPADSGVPRPVVMTNIEGKADTEIVRYQAEFNASIVANDSGALMVEAQVPYLNWEFPKLVEGPKAGSQTCVHFNANSAIIIENHYVNITTVSQATPNGKGKVIINLWKSTDASPAPAAMMFAKQHNISIPPNSDVTFKKDCFWDNYDPITSQPLYILGMTGHFHSRGKSFWVEKVKNFYDANNNIIADSAQTIYSSSAWSEPPFQVYNPPIKLELSKGEFLRYHAEYVNTTSNTYIFGPHVKTQEHMNLFTWFYSPVWTSGTTFFDDNP